MMIPRLAVAASPAEYVTGVLGTHWRDKKRPLDIWSGITIWNVIESALKLPNLPNRKSARTCDDDENQSIQ